MPIRARGARGKKTLPKSTGASLNSVEKGLCDQLSISQKWACCLTWGLRREKLEGGVRVPSRRAGASAAEEKIDDPWRDLAQTSAGEKRWSPPPFQGGRGTVRRGQGNRNRDLAGDLPAPFKKVAQGPTSPGQEDQ